MAEVFSEKFKTVENHAPAPVIEENPPKLQPKIAAEDRRYFLLLLILYLTTHQNCPNEHGNFNQL